jgi:hypothetical protein
MGGFADGEFIESGCSCTMVIIEQCGSKQTTSSRVSCFSVRADEW